MNAPTTNKDSALKSVWVWAVLGLFATMFTVNYAFFSTAVDTSPGLVNEEYYKYGLQQNKIDKQYRQQAQRGWNIDLNLADSWDAGKAHQIQMTATDKDGNLLKGGFAEVTAYRPSDAKADILSQLNETKPGHYESSITLPMKGVWDINILFTHNGEKHMFNKRVSISGDDTQEKSTLENIVDFILVN